MQDSTFHSLTRAEKYHYVRKQLTDLTLFMMELADLEDLSTTLILNTVQYVDEARFLMTKWYTKNDVAVSSPWEASSLESLYDSLNDKDLPSDREENSLQGEIFNLSDNDLEALCAAGKRIEDLAGLIYRNFSDNEGFLNESFFSMHKAMSCYQRAVHAYAKRQVQE